MYNLGLISLGHQVESVSPIFGFLFKVFGYCGNAASIFIHCSLCFAPCIHKAIDDEISGKQAINALLNAVKNQFIILLSLPPLVFPE